MQKEFRRKLLAASLMVIGTGGMTQAMAQSPEAQSMALEEIVVTARRRDETLQDVPLTVNVVTTDQLDQLNIRKFEDIQGVVAGLTLQEDTIAPNASMRGVRFDTFASGNNATVEFYLNDAPISSLSAIQALFDVGQIEVLRGPQGTLRGRASPSGSITITSQRPIMDDLGGYIDVTAGTNDTKNVRAALNVPIIDDVLAFRVAGFWEENSINDVKSAFTGDTSEYKGDGYRFSVGFHPTDNLSLNAMYQRIDPDRKVWYPVESANLANPNLAAADRLIKDSDRLSVHDNPEDVKQSQERFNLELAWEVAGQEINYVYSDTKQTVDRLQPVDWTIGPTLSTPTARLMHGRECHNN